MVVSSEDDESLIEEREAQMVSHSGRNPFCRIAHFLKPPTSSSSSSSFSAKQAQTLCNYHPSKPISPILNYLSSKVVFNGWNHPLPEWSSWIEKLRPMYEAIWKQSNTYEALMASKNDIPKCKHSIFALAEKWCSETNTFVLPWGEVTITLEDVMVLGGFSVTGDSVLSKKTSKELGEIEESLLLARLELVRSKSKKATQQQWLKMWMGKGKEFEHEAFLCLWLSRFIFPDDSFSTMNKSAFQFAVLLARGIRIALAPAVLASIYRDLSLLKEKIVSIRELIDENDANVTKLRLWAPLQFLQVWFWERFPKLSPKPNPMNDSVSRLIRWHKVKVSTPDGDVGLAMDLASDDFRWRPYSKPLNNWSFDIDLQSYGRCIRANQLVGLDDCIESYFPHWVAMQFGLDQDIPTGCPRWSGTKENAWSDYNREIKDMKLYMPPKHCESHVTIRYLDWWKKSKDVKESSGFEVKKEGSMELSKEMGERMRIKIENNEAEVPSGFSPIGKRVAKEEDDSFHEHQSSAKQLKRSTEYPVIVVDSSDSDASPSSSRIKEAETKDDSHDDHITLSKLFSVKDAERVDQRESLASQGSSSRIKEVETKNSSDDDHIALSKLYSVNGAKRVDQRGSPSSSAGDNTCIQDIRSVANNDRHVLPSEQCITKELTVEVGTQSKAASPIRSSINVDKNNVPTSFNGAHESSDIDLLNRIARLRRIVDWVKTAKTDQA